jgi:hypothetical protein
MKNIVFAIISFFLFSTAIASNVGDNERETTMNYTKIDNKTALITVSNAEDGGTLTLEDENGFVLYREFINRTAYAKKYNFDMLPIGDYKLRLDMGDEILEREIEVGSSAENVLYPAVITGENYFKILYENNENDAIVMSFYNEASSLVYKKYYKAGEQIADRYRLDELEEGEYNLFISGDDFSVNKVIKVNNKFTGD